MTASFLTKRQLGKAATREKIIGASRVLFSARGYERVHIRDIAAAIGMSTGAVFSSFSDKAAVFEAAMGRPAPDVAEFVRGLCSRTPPGVGDLPERAAALLMDLVGEEGVRAFAAA